MEEGVFSKNYDGARMYLKINGVFYLIRYSISCTPALSRHYCKHQGSSNEQRKVLLSWC